MNDVLRSLLGITALLGLAWACSADRARIPWRTVLVGIAIQVLLALLVLRLPWFRGGVEFFSGVVVSVLGFTREGAVFVFGDLADSDKFGFVFCFQVLPTIIFVSALTSLCYYLGLLQAVVGAFAWVMTRTMRLSGAESLAAAANVFVGQTEAPLMVRPYIAAMTRSELNALMTGGFATIAGSVLGAYIAFLAGGDVEEQKRFAKLLLCASLMNAPAALVMAKLLLPERAGPRDGAVDVPREGAGANLLDALAQGTTAGLRLALNVAAMLIVFLSLIAMVNWVLGDVIGAAGPGETGWLNDRVREWTGGQFETLSLEALLGTVGFPFAWLIGAEAGDLWQVGRLLGTKLVVNEFVAYLDLGALREAGGIGAKSVFVTTFALCGFANFGSIGIQLGGIGAMAPERRADIAALAFRALLGGTLASLLTAAVAGAFFTPVP